MSAPTGSPRAEAARSVTWLFVPGDRPERFERARGSGADEVICDLEDAVAPEGKAAAREQVCRWLAAGGTAWVRVNCPDTQWWAGDLAALTDAPGLRGVVVPKADDPARLGGLRKDLGEGVGVVALVESALGIARAFDLAGSGTVDRLAFGSIDYAVDIDATEDDESLLYARSTLVVASRAGGLPAPIDGVTRSFDDPELVAAEAGRARRLGFKAKLCIHPTQLEPVTAAFRPTGLEVAWARSVLTAVASSGPGAVAAGGQMIDKPIVERAQRIVDQAVDGSGPGGRPEEGR